MEISLNHFDRPPLLDREQRQRCPSCSDSRKPANRNKKCFYYKKNHYQGNILVTYNCQNCGLRGAIKLDKNEAIKNMSMLDQFLIGRGISPNKYDKLVASNDAARKILFKYPNGGFKERNAESKGGWRTMNGANHDLYNGQCIGKDMDYLMITEGEMDTLAILESGFKQVVSVPNGASTNFSAILETYPELKTVKRIIAAIDADEPAEALMRTIKANFDCPIDRVNWQGSKDANELLMNSGAESVRYVINAAINSGSEGLISLNESMLEYIEDVRENGVAMGEPLGACEEMDKLVLWNKGRFRVWTGIPSHGKTTFTEWVAFELADRKGWKFGIYSGETSDKKMVLKLIQLRLNHQVNTYVSKSIIMEAYEWVKKHFKIFKTLDEFNSLQSIMNTGVYLAERDSIDCIIVDNFTSLDRELGVGDSAERSSINKSINEMQSFCKRTGKDFWLVAHPRKMGLKSDGTFQIPDAYAISGSASFYNAPDHIMCIYRDYGENGATDTTRMIVQKQRHQDTDGKQGTVYFEFNPFGRRFHTIGINPSNKVDLSFINKTIEEEEQTFDLF